MSTLSVRPAETRVVPRASARYWLGAAESGTTPNEIASIRMKTEPGAIVTGVSVTWAFSLMGKAAINKVSPRPTGTARRVSAIRPKAAPCHASQRALMPPRNSGRGFILRRETKAAIVAPMKARRSLLAVLAAVAVSVCAAQDSVSKFASADTTFWYLTEIGRIRSQVNTDNRETIPALLQG